MTPIVDTQIDNTCLIRILDMSYDEYIPENLSDLDIYYQRNKYRYSDTATINIIYQFTTEHEEGKIIDTLITSHCVHLDEAYYSIPKDGYYTIQHIILPTTDWLNFVIENGMVPSLSIFVTDGEKFYQYVNNVLVDVDPRVIAEIGLENTTISRTESKIFSLCNLLLCYINTCKLIFKKYNIRCLPNDYKSIVFNRDFIWMTLNVIKYNIDFGDYFEAQRILENINYCGGFCELLSSTVLSGCGCSKA